jgi:hypothetical protein
MAEPYRVARRLVEMVAVSLAATDVLTEEMLELGFCSED